MLRLEKLLRRQVLPRGAAVACDSLHSVEQMRQALARERFRSDRGNTVFSLLTFTYPSACDEAELAILAGIFRRRLRLTDQAGLLAPRRVGVLLPLTSAEGAWTVAEEIIHRLPPEVRRPECDVYTYTGSVDRFDDDTSGSSNRNLKSAGSNSAGRRAEGVASGHRSESLSRVNSMQALFVEPLPMWKRTIDVVGAGTALLVASPLIVLTGLAIKLSSRGPVFYLQERDGLLGRKFRICKFRTMVVDADALKAQLRALSEQDGPAFKLKDDPRVTWVGRLLRRTCLDELPQLFNVLKGDMTLVGPRPMCSKEARHCSSWQRRRLDVTPGMTCIWQVEGGTKTTFADWMRMDLRYARSRSMWSDLRLLLMTIPSIIRRDGIY